MWPQPPGPLRCGSVEVTIATRGFPEHGGDSSNVQDQIRSVQQVHSTARAFAATLEGGSFFVIECAWW